MLPFPPLHPSLIAHSLIPVCSSLTRKPQGPYGLKSWTVIKFDSGSDGSPPQYRIQATLVWELVDQVKTAVASEAGKAVFADVPNFSNKSPLFLMGNVEGTWTSWTSEPSKGCLRREHRGSMNFEQQRDEMRDVYRDSIWSYLRVNRIAGNRKLASLVNVNLLCNLADCLRYWLPLLVPELSWWTLDPDRPWPVSPFGEVRPWMWFLDDLIHMITIFQQRPVLPDVAMPYYSHSLFLQWIFEPRTVVMPSLGEPCGDLGFDLQEQWRDLRWPSATAVVVVTILEYFKGGDAFKVYPAWLIWASVSLQGVKPYQAGCGDTSGSTGRPVSRCRKRDWSGVLRRTDDCGRRGDGIKDIRLLQTNAVSSR